jgi:site-specific DNA-methyltransferase (adenine-specific)
MALKPYYSDAYCTLFLGDCRDVLPQLAPGSVDLVLTDPPYGVSLPGVGHWGPSNGTRNFDFFPNDDLATSVALACEAAELCFPLLTPDASAYWWAGHRQFAVLSGLYEQRDWNTRFLVWSKECRCPPPPGAGWPSAAELCLYAWRHGRKWTHDGKNFPRSNVIVADSYRYGQPGKVAHPTQKPLEVVMPLIRASTLEGDTVLDCFSGSGTTLVAAKEMARRCVGVEIEESYCEITAKRLEQGVLEFSEPTEARQ